MSRTNKNGLILASCSAVLLVLAILMFVIRARAFHREQDRPMYVVERFVQRTIDNLEDYPPLTLTDVTDDAGNAYLRADFGPRIELIPVQTPPVAGTPTLELYDEWAKLLWINEVSRDPATRQQHAIPGTGRLVLVVRRPPIGYDPQTWGRVRRSENIFDFYTFKPGGEIEIEVRRWPRTYSSENYLQERARRAAAGESDDEVTQQLRDPDGLDLRAAEALALVAIPPLEQRSWRWIAALHVIPKLSVPQQKFDDTALNVRVAGWTLPIMFFASLGLAFGVAMLIAPERVKAKTPPDKA